MKFGHVVWWCTWCILGTRAFILIPEELPSLLSVLYGSIPPIKKGTDSRVGFGFRLGPNADFQVQFEIGPQLNTQPLGPNPNATSSSSSSTRKRQTHHHAASAAKLNFDSKNPSERWLNTWRQKLNKDEDNEVQDTSSHAHNDPTKENFSFVSHLRQLYDAAKKSNDSAIS